MPKRPVKKRRGLRSRRETMSSTVLIPFRDVTTIHRTASSGYEISTINLNIPSFASTSRVRTLAEQYEFFRFRNLKVSAITDTAGVSVYETGSGAYFLGYAHGVGFIPSASGDFTAPVDFNELLQFPNAVLAPAQRAVNVSMSMAQLSKSTPTQWYHTRTTGTPPAADSSAGAVVYMTRASSPQLSQSTYSYLTVSGVLELKAPLASGDALNMAVSTVGEERKLRIDTVGEHFDYDHPRTGVRDEFALRNSSVQNTPRSACTVVATATDSVMQARSDRNQFDRPRLVRQ